MKQHTTGRLTPAGSVTHAVTRHLGDLEARPVTPAPLGWRLRNWWQHDRRGAKDRTAIRLLGRVSGLVPLHASLSLAHYRPDFSRLDAEQWLRLQAWLRRNAPVHELAAAFGGRVVDYGVVGTRVVTTAGVGFLVDAFQNLTELENLKYHGIGTGSTAEASGDTALVTEWAGSDYTGGVRATGSTTEGASANIYRTVGTNTKASAGTSAIVEHGVFSASSAGTLWDRTVFAAVNLSQNDALQSTYDCTFPAGS